MLRYFSTQWTLELQKHYLMTQRRSDIHIYLSVELLRVLFLYSIEVNQMKFVLFDATGGL